MKVPPLVPQKVLSSTPSVTGQWFEIKYVPDIGIDESRNVGVAFVDGEGNIHSKLLNYPSGLRQIQGGHSTEMIRFLLHLLEETLKAGEMHSPSPHLLFGPRRFARGETVQAILEDAFATSVTLAHPRPTRRHWTAWKDTATVRKQVLAALRKIGGDRAETIIARRPTVVTDAAGQTHALDLPLLGAGMSGSIVSGCYRSAAITEVNLLRAAMELETAARVVPNARRGLFVLQSGGVGPGRAVARQSSGNRLVRIEWQLHQLDVHVGMASHPDRLAQQILTWAEGA